MPAPGKYGRLPLDRTRPRLIVERYLDPRSSRFAVTQGLPPITLTTDVDYSSHVPQIPMYLNDQIGDCTIAGEAHFLGAMSFYASGAEVLFADPEIQSVYSRVGGYDPSQAQPDGSNPTDTGCQVSDVLADLKANGITDTAGTLHKCLGYASMGNPSDELLIGQLLDVFGSVYVGFNVQQSIETEFSNGQVWTWTPGEATIGGHCVVLQRRYPAGSMHGILEYWTWGARQRADFGWQSAAVEEAWVVITKDWVNRNGLTPEGIDVQQLLSDMQYV